MNEGTISRDRGSTPSSHRKEGFAEVARWIALDSDNETFIYRKFDELAARNLLYQQSELLVRQKQLNEMDRYDASSEDMDLKDTSRTWEMLKRRNDIGNEETRVHRDLIVQLRARLKEYCALIVACHPVAKANRSVDEALFLLQSEIAKPNRPNKFIPCARRRPGEDVLG